jgi:alpha-beta hydrolase superfamily lysophospholipase
MTEPPPQFLAVGRGAARRDIAVRVAAGRRPAVVWLGGFGSTMTGTKAGELARWGGRAKRTVVRFDYSGHGESGGHFENGTISRWLEESLAVIRRHGGRAPVLVGSSMGGWLALLAARALGAGGNPPSGIVLVAPAVDFTEALIWPAMTAEARRTLADAGVWLRPNPYGPEPEPITRALIEDGRRHLLLTAPFAVGAPVRILQGMADEEVPWSHAQALVEHLAEDDVTLTLVKDGDHRLSRPQDLALLISALEDIHES